jgi:hypothetical protein
MIDLFLIHEAKKVRKLGERQFRACIGWINYCVGTEFEGLSAVVTLRSDADMMIWAFEHG